MSKFNYIYYLSTSGLRQLHNALASALAADDAEPNPGRRRYGVRVYPDWRLQVEAIEGALAARKVPFRAVAF